MPQSPQLLAQALIDAINLHDVERAIAFYATDYEEIDIAQAQPQIGRDTVRRKLLAYWRAFPDMTFTLDEVIVEGDRLVMVWHWCGTHRGTMMNIPPTGRTVTARGASILALENGLIQRGTRIWDLAGLLRGMGLLTEL